VEGRLIVRRYGANVLSVQPDFDANAMNEIGFRRDNDWSLPADEFFGTYGKVSTHELTAEAEGDVQTEAERALLTSLQEQLLALASSAGDDVIFIESEPGTDYPKTRHTQTTLVVEGANRLYFRFSVRPPLRVAVYHRQ
jgi:hypothetical protein